MYTHMHNIIIILYLVSLGMRRMEECGVVWIEWAPHGGVPLQLVGGWGLYTGGERTTELLKLCSVRNTVHQLSAKIIIYSFCDSLTGLYMYGCILILPVIGNHISRGIGQMEHVRISQHLVKSDQVHTDICPISWLV